MKPTLLIFALVVTASSNLAAQDDPKQLPPTLANVSYGPHDMNVLDFWRAEGDGPRPLLVYIHGGGWVGGDKKRNKKHVLPYLEKGISYAAVNYRLTGEAPLPEPCRLRSPPALESTMRHARFSIFEQKPMNGILTKAESH